MIIVVVRLHQNNHPFVFLIHPSILPSQTKEADERIGKLGNKPGKCLVMYCP